MFEMPSLEFYTKEMAAAKKDVDDATGNKPWLDFHNFDPAVKKALENEPSCGICHKELKELPFGVVIALPGKMI